MASFGQDKSANIEYNSFTIAENPQASYEGKLKDGKPFSGYFKTDENEFWKVNFYENGVIKFQYSYDYIKNAGDYAHPNLNIKATFKDGKIFDGPEYTIAESALLTRNFKNGRLENFIFGIFAMNYFNQIIFDKKSDTITIKNSEEQDMISKIYFDGKSAVRELLYKGNSIYYSKEIIFDIANLPKNHTISEVIKDKKTRCFAVKKLNIDESVPYSKINLKILGQINLFKSDNLDSAFIEISEYLKQDNSTYLLFKNGAEGDHIYTTHLETNSDGKIMSGIRFENNSYQIYKENKILKKEKTTLNDFQSIYIKYLNSLYE